MKLGLLAINTFILLLTLTLSADEHDVPLPRNLEIWFTSAPGAYDFIDMVTEYDNPRFGWHKSRRYVHGIKFYQGQLLEPAHPMFGSNTYLNLKSSNALWIIDKRLEKKIAIEVGAIKDHECPINVPFIERMADASVQAVLNVYRANGVVHYLDIDNSFGSCGQDSRAAAIYTAYWSRSVENKLENEIQNLKLEHVYVPIKFRDIEAYPFHPAKEYRSYVERLNHERISRGYRPFDGFYIDIDERIVKDADLERDVKFLTGWLHEGEFKVGLIINGPDVLKPEDDNDLFYLNGSNHRLARFNRLGLFENIDMVMVQSWATRYKPKPEDLRDLPLNVPEDAITHTNFLWHTIRCLGKIKDCEFYP